MARGLVTVSTPLGGYPAVPLTALSAVMALTAADTVNFNAIPSTGRELIVVWNSHATVAATVSILSTADERNRTGDITTYNIVAQTIAIFGPFPQKGWRQIDGNIWINGSAATLMIGAIILPVF